MKENHQEVVVAWEPVLGGVDTHKDVHVAAILGRTGALLSTAEFPATLGGHATRCSSGCARSEIYSP